MGSVDALTMLAVGVLLLVVVALATYGPLVRAARVDARAALAAEYVPLGSECGSLTPQHFHRIGPAGAVGRQVRRSETDGQQ